LLAGIEMGKRDYYRKGTIEMVVLSLLSESDLYGYQIAQAISEKSEGAIKIQMGSLYPVFYKLRDDGFISEQQVPIGNRKFRVYYHIEPSGEKLLQDLILEHNAFEAGLSKIIASYK